MNTVCPPNLYKADIEGYDNYGRNHWQYTVEASSVVEVLCKVANELESRNTRLLDIFTFSITHLPGKRL